MSNQENNKTMGSNTNNNNILDRVDRRTGMTVPDGYFSEFAARMAASLPEQEWEHASAATAARRPIWEIVRPYVYMAAMFLGVWCMMNIFSHISSSPDMTLESNPVLAQAVGSDTFIDEYILDDTDSSDLLDDVWNESI